MAVKMSPKFVVLCSLAVGAIYTTGYSISSTSGNALADAAQSTPPSAASSGQGSNGEGMSGTANQSASSSNQNAAAGNSTANQSNNQTNSSKSTSKSSAAKTVSQSSASASASKSASSTAKTSTSTTKSSTSTTKSSTSSSTAKTTAPPVQYRYLNGTYSGSGSNRIGTVQVAVSIHNGKITAVQITGCYTHYPQYYIDPLLPNYVVDHQTTQIPYVSGATLSSDDFHNAVVEALSKASNPNYKG